MDRNLIEKIQKMRKDGKSFGEISKELLITKSSACYCNKIDLKEYDDKKSAKEKYENDVCELAKKSRNFNQMCKILGKHPTNETIRLIKKILDKNNVDYSHFISEPEKYNTLGNKKDINEFLVSGVTVSVTHLKERLLKEGIKEYRCERCGGIEWEGEKIPLQLHHINGDRTDNRLENLQVLCPNCHALTDNYCRKKMKKEKKHCAEYKAQNKCPSRNDLIEKFKEYGSFKSVGEHYKVSDNAVRKWCAKYSLPIKCKEMRGYIRENFGNDIKWNFLKTNDALSKYQNLKYPKRCLIGYDGKIEKIYSSEQELKDDGYSPKRVLSVCKGKLKTHHHRVFKFYDE